MSGRSGRPKILEEIHPLQIIREVQKWPALYARESAERASAHHRRALWAAVASRLFRAWPLYSRAQRHDKVTDLIKKWRNLRDTFKRQLTVEKKIKEGMKIKKKTYVYYNHMSFLLPHVQSDSEHDERAEHSRSERSDEPPPGELAHGELGREAARGVARPRRRGLRRTDHIDEDRHFLLSLVPSFRRMSADHKLSAKVEILQVIKRIRAAAAFPHDLDDGDVRVKEEMLDAEELEVHYRLAPDDASDSNRDDSD